MQNTQDNPLFVSTTHDGFFWNKHHARYAGMTHMQNFVAVEVCLMADSLEPGAGPACDLLAQAIELGIDFSYRNTELKLWIPFKHIEFARNLHHKYELMDAAQWGDLAHHFYGSSS